MESKIFANPFFDFMNTLCNFIVLNLVFLITCLPVVTIGAALSSLYYVTLKEARGEYGYLVRPYLREFRRNLKKGTKAFLILALSGAVLLFSLVFWIVLGSSLSPAVCGLLIAGAILWFFIVLYAFPLMGRFENSVGRTLKNAAALALGNKRATLALCFIDALVFFLCVFAPVMKLFMVLLGFAFVAYCHSFILNRVFAPYES